MQLAANIFAISTLLIAAALPIWSHIKTGSYSRLILYAWGTIFAWAVLNCLALPALLFAFGVDDSAKYFPEGPAVAASGIAGWIFGLELAVLVLIVRGGRWVFRRVYRHSDPMA